MMSARVQLMFVYWLSIVLSILNIGESKAVGEAFDSSGLDYLIDFGYISKPKDGQAQEAKDISKSLKAFQRFAGLNVTGKFDKETVKLMKAPRCGDKDQISNGKRRRRYLVEGSKWQKKDLTYRILNDPYKGPTNRHIMTPELISKTIKAALQKWSYAADLTFTEMKEGEADIMIKFTAGDHGDQYKFDGRGKKLAHAFYPSQNKGYAGDAHFDLDEKFSLTEEDSTNFIWVTTHEFGHSLGLRHSRDAEAIMYPFYTTGKMGDAKLGKDDKRGIQSIYGKSVGRRKEPRIILPEPPRKECKYSFNAFFHDKKEKIYALREYEFYVLHQNKKPKGPKSVGDRWKEVNGEIRAAYKRTDGHTVFFTRYRYFRYHGHRLVEGPAQIEEYGLPSDLRDMDAAVSFSDGRTYFFKKDKYWKYDERKKAIVEGYPKLIKDFWRGIPDNIDAALQTPEGDVYFFKGLQYYKLKLFGHTTYPGYPKPIGPYWLKCKDRDSDMRLSNDNSAALAFRPSYIIVLLTAFIWIVIH